MLLSVLTVAVGVPGVARADGPPRRATIVEGDGMAGARLGSAVSLGAGGDSIDGEPFEDWGPVRNGFCYEQSCMWRVPGGGSVTAQFDGDVTTTSTLRTDARRWKTKRGIGPRSAVRAMRRRYPRAFRVSSCTVSPFGAPLWGYAVNRRDRRTSTFFEVSGRRAKRIRAVWIVPHRVSRGGGSC